MDSQLDRLFRAIEEAHYKAVSAELDRESKQEALIGREMPLEWEAE